MTEEQKDCGLQIADCGFDSEDGGQTTERAANEVEEQPAPPADPCPAESDMESEEESTPAPDTPGTESTETDVATNPQSEIPNPQSVAPTVESVLEAILFASDEPLTDNRLAGIVETTAKQVRDCLDALNKKYEAARNAFRIEPIAGGYQMLTLSVYNEWLKKMLRDRSDNKLSPAALETLAIVAYKQPVIRADIESIRGVAVGEVLRSLMYKGLVKIVGRAEILGHPMLYGTTKKFLEVFGLNSLKDLPKAEELKKPD
jgi:segregation and condensation protein B